MGMSGPQWSNFNYCCGEHYSPEDISDNPKRKRVKRGAIPQLSPTLPQFLSVQFPDPPEQEEERHQAEDQQSEDDNPDENIQYSQVILFNPYTLFSSNFNNIEHLFYDYIKLNGSLNGLLFESICYWHIMPVIWI